MIDTPITVLTVLQKTIILTGLPSISADIEEIQTQTSATSDTYTGNHPTPPLLPDIIRPRTLPACVLNLKPDDTHDNNRPDHFYISEYTNSSEEQSPLPSTATREELESQKTNLLKYADYM